MALKDKYISDTDKKKDPSNPNVVLTDDIYALCEMLERLSNELNTLANRRK